MSKLKQISCRYNQVEDRLLLSISADDKTEFRLWLTRRFTLSIVTDFKQDTATLRADKDGVASANVQDMADFQQASDAQEQDFEQKFTKGENFPLGENGLLVQSIHITPKDGDNLLLTLMPSKGQGINLNINKKILNNFFEVIDRALEVTGWVNEHTIPKSSVLH